MSDEEEKQEGEIDFSKLTRQNILYRLAKASIDTTGRGILIDYEIVMKLLARLGEDPLRKRWKDKTEQKLKILKDIGKKASQINFHLLSLDDESISKEKKIVDYRFLKARKEYADIVDNLDVIYEALYTLIDATTTLKNLSIPHEYFQDKSKKPTSAEIRS
ncbi:MAG: hypothetical protein ABIA37_02450 [Candidatus Woesearchaeota archaeon]